MRTSNNARLAQNNLRQMCTRLILLSLVSLLTPALTCADSGFYAARLTAENIERLPDGGTNAIGGLGDWLLTDGELCAVVSSREHVTYFSLSGGVLVDVWHCNQANDQWSTLHPQFNLQKDEIPHTQHISAGHDTDSAWLETLAERDGLVAKTRYQLHADIPGQLVMTTDITRVNPGKALTMYGLLALHPNASLSPFAIDIRGREYSRGARLLEVDTSKFSSILRSVAAVDLQLLLGSRHSDAPISYGMLNQQAMHVDLTGNTQPVTTFLMGGLDFSLMGVFSRPLPSWWSRQPGAISFLRSQLFDLDEGERLHLQQTLFVGGADAASITDRLYEGAVVQGRIDTANASITVTDDAGQALTFARPTGDGSFKFRLPLGVHNATLSIETPWSRQTRTVAVADNQTDLGEIATGAVATLHLPRGQPMSLAFAAVDTRPIFNSELIGSRSISAASNATDAKPVMSGPQAYQLYLSGTTADIRHVQLPPGNYTVYASRGPEFSVTQTQITLHANQSKTLDIAPPQRVVATPGLLCADLHLHSGVSFDSNLKPEQRVIDFVAQGCEVLTATEHSITYDLSPVIERLGLAQEILSLPGVELTGMVRTPAAPRTIAHSNVFPVPPNPEAFMGGTLAFEGKRLGQVIGDYKTRFPNSVFQLNHPRDSVKDDDLAYFNHLSQGMGYNPSLTLIDAPNNLLLEKLEGSEYRDIDFDAIELLNGESMERYALVRDDWFSLLRQNVYKVATANSDSHHSAQLVAYPRNMIAVDSDNIVDVSPTDVVRAIKSGHLYGTTGPMLFVDLSGTPPGGTFVGNRGTLQIRVEQAHWVTATQAHIWLNGELQQTVPLTMKKPLNIVLDAKKDSFVFVEVAGEPSGVYQRVAPDFAPFAFANPIFIDVDGDGWNFGQRETVYEQGARANY